MNKLGIWAIALAIGFVAGVVFGLSIPFADEDERGMKLVSEEEENGDRETTTHRYSIVIEGNGEIESYSNSSSITDCDPTADASVYVQIDGGGRGNIIIGDIICRNTTTGSAVGTVAAATDNGIAGLGTADRSDLGNESGDNAQCIYRYINVDRNPTSDWKVICRF